jgi:glycosyltransferase involved in cell wall biosynthesis
MEILFVSHKYPPSTGGMEKQSFELINGMKQHLSVHAIVYSGTESRLKFFMQLNRRIKQICRDNPKISVIHFNDGLIATGSLMHKGYGHLKRSVTLHGLDVVFPGIIYQRFIIPLFNRFDLIFAVSRATARACEVRGIKKEKIVVINNGVDTNIRPTASRDEVDHLLQEKYNINCSGRRILIAMGRPVKRKGFSWFMENVMPSLHEDFILLLIGPVRKQRNTGARLLRLLPGFISTRIELFLGFPGDETAIERLLGQPAIAGKVARLGKLPFADITAILSASDAFVMPNIEVKGDMEGFGLVCLEACMCGTKVFAAASGGITDAIQHKKNGILLSPGDVGAWIAALNEVAGNPRASGLVPDEIIAFTSRQFSWEKMTIGYLTHFLALTRS